MSRAIEKRSTYLSGIFTNGGEKYPVRIEVTHTRNGWQALCTTELPRRGVIPPYTGSFGPFNERSELLSALRKTLSNIQEIIEL